MNPTGEGTGGLFYHFPRASGDEPKERLGWDLPLGFSPREWG